MTEEMLKTVLDTAQAKTDKDGWDTLPEGRAMTLYGAHAGVSFTAGKVDSLRLARGIVHARTTKGETFLIALEDLFAAAVDAGNSATASRKAGFIG
jgi:hypothetical protein